jgi:multidrug efflux pump subunit AcrA (membrane-fusion protein)
VRLLGRLASAVVATGEPVWYAGDTRDLAPQVEDAVQEYVDDAHSKMIAVLPLGRPKPDHEADEEDKEHIDEPVGALIVEQIEDNRVAPAMAQRIDVVCKHSSIALANAMEHQNLFLMPVWRAIGKSKFLVQARTLPKTVLAVVGVVVLLLALFLLKADFDLHAKGTLDPVDRSDVYTNVDGQVSEFGVDVEGKPIKEGSWVKKDQMLLRLVNPKLDQTKLEIDGQIAIEKARYQELEVDRSLHGPGMKPDERERLMGQLTESKEKINSLENQAKVFQAQIDDLVVHSPIDGQIVTWDLKKQLDRRPVQKGNFLLRVADTKGPWRLDLNMTDDRMGHIARQENLVKNTQDPNLKVSYQVATAPGKTLNGTVEEIAVVANPEKEIGNVVVIRVKINKDDINPADLKAGAEASGKVHCGRQSLGYVWFHDLFEFIQTKVFFRFL